MSQHDMTVANQSFPAFRADMNLALKALASTSVGNSAPGTPFTGQLWLDSNTPSATVWNLSVYDGSGWQEFLAIDTADGDLTTIKDLTLGGDLKTGGNDILDANGNVILGFSATASADDYVQLGNHTSLPFITAAGSDTNIGLHLFGKGSGKVQLGDANLQWPDSDGSNGQVLQTNGSATLSWTTPSSAPSAASQAEMEAASSNTVYATPGRIHFHPGVAKGWVKYDQVADSVLASRNVTGVTDTSAGNFTVVWATDFSSANYAYSISAEATSGNEVDRQFVANGGQAAGTLVVNTYNNGPSLTDMPGVSVVGFGDFA